MSTARQVTRALSFLLADRRGLWLLFALYLLSGLALFYFDAALNDEGLIIHYMGTWAVLDLPTVLFAQKSKPVLAVLYALPSLGGVLVTMVSHLVVSALAVPLIGGFARQLGYRLPNFAALVVGFSPIFFLGGAAGIANNDAIVGTALVLYLLGRGHSLLGGLVLACLPWVRSEMAPLVAILAVHALVIERNPRFLIGIVLFVVVYALAGAAYHNDLLWMIHYPPASPANPDNPMWQGIPVGPQFLLGFLMAITPVAALVTWVPVRRLHPLERTLMVYLIVMIVLLDVMPIFRIGNFGGSPRYQAQLLPVLALCAARALEGPWEGARLQPAAAIAALALTVWSATRIPELLYPLPVVAAFTVIVVLAWLGRGQAAALVATMLVFAGPVLVPGTEIARRDVAAYVEPMADWLKAHRDKIHGPIYTNSQLLDAFTELHGDPKLDVRFMMGFDFVEGIQALTNPYNGQREAVLRLSEKSFYGHGVIASTVRPEDLPPGTLFAIRLDRRTDITFPPEIWRDRLEILFEEGNARIARLR